MYADPDGEMFWFVPIIVGAAIGGTTGAIRAERLGMDWYQGLWGGALVGAVGGALSMVGGGTFVANVAWGAGQGALTGGFDAALWGSNFGQGMAYGAAAGMLFSTFTSENMKNMVKGKGFKNNENVFKDFQARKYSIPEGSTWQQEALDYFGFNGSYNPNVKVPDYAETTTYFGNATATGEIFYGDMAFTSYDNLNATYVKELYHRTRRLKGIPYATQDVIPEANQSLRIYPEERLGFIHQYKNKGLYLKTTINIKSQIGGYEGQIFDLATEDLYKYKWWHFIYNIPRRW